jgi:hypothetical protein
MPVRNSVSYLRADRSEPAAAADAFLRLDTRDWHNEIAFEQYVTESPILDANSKIKHMLTFLGLI